jgi:hypothetical protein
MTHGVDETQRRAARVVGFVYLFVLAPALFAEFYVPSRVIDYNDAAETARNIVAHERLFRLGIASSLVVFAADVVLVTAGYVVLEPVNRHLALLAAFFRLLETTILVVVTLSDFSVLRVLSGAEYLRPFEADALQALARLSIAAHSDAYNVGLLFFGFGSPVFCYLWLKSGYVPRALAAWGMLASLLVGACAFAFIVSPELRRVVTVGYYGGPIFAFELAMGCWLLFRGLRPSLAARDDRAGDPALPGAA